MCVLGGSNTQKERDVKILFIIPPFPARTYPGKTMGPDYLVSALFKHGFTQVEILDLDVLGVKALKREMKKDYDLIGISFLSFQTDVAMKIAEKCHRIMRKKGRRRKKSREYVPIIVGNCGATWGYELARLYPHVDLWCLGEGLETIVEIAEYVEKGTLIEDRRKIKGTAFLEGRKIVVTEKRPLVANVDEYIPVRLHHYRAYDFDIFDYRKTAQVMTSFGCPYACVFCSEAMRGPVVRERSLESIRKEIEILVKEGYRGIYFDDSTFTYRKKRTLAIAKMMKEFHENYGLVWGFNTRVDCLDEEVLRTVKESGCVYLFCGVESLTPEVVAGMNKIIPQNRDYPPLVKTPEEYVERAKKVYRIMDRFGITKSCFLIFGGPKRTKEKGEVRIEVESFEDAKRTIETAVFELNPEYISINILRFIPDAVMSFAKPYAKLRGQKEPITGRYFSSKYRKMKKIRKRHMKHPIYLAFEAASDFYMVPPKITPRYAYDILKYLVDMVNLHNKISKTKTLIWVDKEFRKYLRVDKDGIHHLTEFSEIG